MHQAFNAVLISLTLASQAAFASDGLLVPPDAALAGTSQAEWTERWWQWAFSFERPKSPVADRTGELCASRQSGDVWFLAGTYGTARVERECTVPAGKTLFFPLVNYVMFRPQGSNASCMSLASQAVTLTNDVSALVLEINGKRYAGLEKHRFASRCFSIVPGQKPDAVGNGYYVAIAPLPKGRHVINFGGVLPDIAQAITYRLTVE